MQLGIPADTHKDQTYFLYRLSQDQLAHVLFPLADLTKSEVRQLAQEFGLPTQSKKDSQGICFIGNVDVREFVSQWLAPQPGEVRDLEGRVVGRHDGVHLHTIGEKVAVDNAVVARLYPELKHELPHFYVAEKQVEDNVLNVVPGSEHPKLYKNETVIEGLHLIDKAVDWLQPVQARLRHGGALVECRVELGKNNTAKVKFTEPQRAITPGQHLVLYHNKTVLGGGIIA
jgi:tRNA-specific 2-thiouridylase